MDKVYTVVTRSFVRFDTEEMAKAHAKELMAQYSSDPHKVVNGDEAEWRMGCEYVTIFIKEVN